MEDDKQGSVEEITVAYRRNSGKVNSEEVDDNASVSSSPSETNFGLKRRLGLLHAVSWNVGSMIGSGIFLTPVGVLNYAGSIGASLIVWTLCGVISMLGGLCYAELALVLGKSGGDYIFLLECYGGAISFMVLAVSLVINFGSGIAVSATTSGEYLTGTFIADECEGSPIKIVIAIAALSIGLTLMINAYSVPLVKRIQVICTVAKVAALIFIIIGGLVYLFQGNTENFENAFEGSETNVGRIALSFYSGMWAYGGWNQVCNITEEISNVKRNVPLSIVLGVVIVTTVYVLTNVSYFAILTTDEMLSSSALALSWADQLIPKFSWTISLSVAVSTFGANLTAVFASSRVMYRASRDEQLPSILGMVHTKKYIPLASVIYIASVGFLYLLPGDIQLLMDMVVFLSWALIGASCAGVIVLRVRRKDTPRPFKVPIPIPVIMVCLSLYFLIAPIVDDPRWIYLVGLGVLFGSLIFYFPFVYYKLRVPGMDAITKCLQLFWELAPSEISDDELQRAAHGEKVETK